LRASPAHRIVADQAPRRSNTSANRHTAACRSRAMPARPGTRRCYTQSPLRKRGGLGSRVLALAGRHASRLANTPHAALVRWINLFVDFLVSKHGFAEALQSDDAAFETLHA
jgi:hypothetical protein